jgi:hypothetical protein
MTAEADNTTVACLSHKMKYKDVPCGKQLKHWLEQQFVD